MDMFAQGDLLIERVDDVEPTGRIIEPDAIGTLVLAEGELSGHRHAIHEQVTMFRDEARARDIPSGLYIAHVKVGDDSATLLHQEHAPITLPRGTYRVRRQRELEPADVRVVAD
jgi:hypothetical protein